MMPAPATISWAPLWGLVGVVVGWFLNQLTSLRKEKRRVTKLQGMLRSELESLRCQIPQKRDIIRQMQTYLKKQEVLPGESVHALRLVYDHYGPELFADLDVAKRNCLHVIYERLRVLDKNLDSFRAEFLEATKNQVLSDPFEAFNTLLVDLDRSCGVVANLIEEYLNDRIVDVFGINRRDIPQ